MKRYLLHILMLLAAWTYCGAQTDVQMSQYYEVPSYFNPAATGLEDNIRIRGASRMQWIGIDNAPKLFLATADMPVKLLGKRLGVGITARQESAGLFRNLTIGAQASYKMRLFKGQLGAGIQIGYSNEVFKGSRVFLPDDNDFHEGTDEAIPTTDVSGGALDMGAGVWYTHKWFYAGLSAQHLTAPTITFSDDTGTLSGGASTGSETVKRYEFTLKRTLYFAAGSNIPIKNTLFEVMPSMMVKTDFDFWRAEVTGRIRYKKFLTAGVGYRHDDALVAILGVEFKGFHIGYSYDYPTSAISKASSGSHEITAGYSLKLNLSDKNRNKHKSIRIM
ncbi:MAG: type IX secretion system membrane protein PorP/SprF [Muribaculaceae bacterium]|nr:type IX secretion system membrane protein PorP/SprF [Muribaculaceae bacterium]